MSIRLDPRRLGALKQLAGEAGVRPGDLVRQWVEERIDAARHGGTAPGTTGDLAARIDALAERIAALEGGRATTEAGAEARPDEPTAIPVAADASAAAEREPAAPAEEAPAATRKRSARQRVAASPRGERVALHDEMIAVLADRGPMTAGDLAAAIVERGRYAPPRSGKPLDAAMVSQRVSNPTYRPRFTREDGRIGLADAEHGS